ncbi:hypothetical protein ACLK19_21275 [Escherichia coli]
MRWVRLSSRRGRRNQRQPSETGKPHFYAVRWSSGRRDHLWAGHASTGASNDIKVATNLARNMVTEWGFSRNWVHCCTRKKKVKHSSAVA